MWVVFALAAAILSAIYCLSAQNIKINANIFMVYRGWIFVILLFPILILKPVVFPVNFYIMSVVQGVISAYVDYVVFKINQQYGSETVSSILPFSVIITFIIWCFLDPALVETYVQNPMQTTMIIVAFAGFILALTQYYKISFTKEALYKLIPILILCSSVVVLDKSIMNYSSETPLMCAYWRSFIAGLVVGIVYLIIYVKNRFPLKDLILKDNLFKSLILLFTLFAIISKNLAMYYTQNPAYVSALAYTSLIWVMIFGRYFKIFKFHSSRKQVSRKWKILFLCSIILLILVSH